MREKGWRRGERRKGNGKKGENIRWRRGEEGGEEEMRRGSETSYKDPQRGVRTSKFMFLDLSSVWVLTHTPQFFLL